jgi:O-antigen/teichoic acid export membrane protein
MFIQRVLSALGWSFALRLGIQVFSWAITLVVIRLLTPQDYGLMSMAMVYLSLAMVWRELGLNALLIQKRDLDAVQLGRIYGAIVIAHIVLTVVLIAAAPLLARVFEDPRLTPVLQALAASLLIMPIASVPRALLQRDLNFKATTVSELWSNIASAAVTLSMALAGYGVWALVGGNLIGTIVLSLVLRWMSPMKIAPRFDLAGLRPHFPFMRHTLWSQTLGNLLVPVGNFIVGKMLGAGPLGLFSMARELAALPVSKASSILAQVAFPAVSEIQNDPALIRSYFLRAVRVQSALMYPAMFGLAACASELLVLVLGEQWRPATLLFALQCLATPGVMISVLLPPIALGRGRPELLVSSLYRSLALRIVMLPLGILLGGIDGLAVASFLNIVFANMIQMRITLRVIDSGPREVLREIGPALANSGLMAATVFAAGFWLDDRLSPWTLLGAKIALGVAIYLPLAWLFDRESFRIAQLLRAKATGRA